MRVHIWLTDSWHYNLSFDEALEIAFDHYAEHEDSHTVVVDASTNIVVNKFQIEGSNRWYTFEELVELACYEQITICNHS